MKVVSKTWITLLVQAIPLAAEQPSPAQKEWALATTGILTEMNGRRHDLLGEMELSPTNQNIVRSQLDFWWGIHNRDELIREVNYLRSRPPNGWDAIRSITLCRYGYQANFLNEDEAWDMIMPAARTLQDTFSSWRALGRSYLAQRDVWSRGLNLDQDRARADLQALFRDLLSLKTSPLRIDTWQRMRADYSVPRDIFNPTADYAYRRLLFDRASPWRRIPWNLDLGGSPASTRKFSNASVGGLTLISRPAGLTCFSLDLPNRTPPSSLVPDIEKVLGCRARVIEERDHGGDWYVSGECVRPDLAKGAEVRAEFRLEPLASRLRKEGVAELFFTISHTPAGTSSLSPPATFHWLNEGMEYDVGSWDLGTALPSLYLRYGFGLAEASRFCFPGLLFSIGIFALALWKKKSYKLAHWTGWTLLVTSTNAIAMVRLTLGQEGLGGDLEALGVLLLLPLLVEISSGPFVHPQLEATRAWSAALWANLIIVPFAGLALTIADLQGGLNLPTIFVAVALTFMIAAFCLRNQYRAMGVVGGEINQGALRDGVFDLAKRARVRLRRVCLIPAGGSPVGVFASGDGSILISEELIKELGKREVEALAARALVGLRSGEMRKRISAAALLAVGVFLGSSWFVYWLGRVGTLLLIFGGLSLACWTLLRLWRFWQYRGDTAAAALTEDPEALISGLAHQEQLSGRPSGPAAVRARRIANRHAIEEKRFLELLGTSGSIVERYSVPILSAPLVYSPM